MKFLVALSLVASALATPLHNNCIYKTPKITSFGVLNARTALPINTTTHDGEVATFPLWKGELIGKFDGMVVENSSIVVERVLPGSDGAHSVVSSDVTFQKDDKHRIIMNLEGQTTYANNALHGFGRALMKTTIPEYDWVNWATFLVEWEGAFDTGMVSFEFFEVNTGGRRDGKPIPALEHK